MRLRSFALALVAASSMAYVACGGTRLAGGNAAFPFGEHRVDDIPRYDSCPDPAQVFRDCTPLPLAINFHYFATDACSPDSIGVKGGRRSEADAITAVEQLVANTNQFFEEISDNPPANNTAHGATEYNAQCAPFRLVLAGVYFHCNSAFAKRLPSPSRVTSYLVNADTELNYFLGNLTTSDGYASSLGSALGAQGGYNPNVLAHEVMHMLGINHVFGNDGCDDTWGDINWTWDRDGDGVADQRGRRCWDWVPTASANGGKSGEPDYCTPGNYHEVHPCCDTTNMNANLMTYSNYASDWYRSTLSPCQVEKAVRHVATRKCAYLYGAYGRRPSREYVVAWPEPTTSPRR